MAFTLDAIWNLRNQILHNGGQANIVVIASNIDHRFQEFVFAITSEKPSIVAGDVKQWPRARTPRPPRQ